ncbi:MAG TPA: hypothetical protein GX705_05155 [Clostridiales bacterium]|nr:hypothetical protein [Clostridiales bacterium]
MIQKRKPMDPEEVDVIIAKMQRRGKYSSDIIQLVQSDLEFGLSKEETEQYTDRKYDIRQMRVYSNCLRRNCTPEEISVICKTGHSNSQMEVLFDFFDKGVPLDTIRTIMDETKAMPQRMKQVYERYQEEINKSKSAVNELSSDEKEEIDADYLKELITLLNGVSDKISYQGSRYDELNKKLKLLETSKEDEAIRKNLIDDLDDKDYMLEKQQEEINKATGAIARLRKEKEACEEEINKMQVQIDDLQSKIKNQEPPKIQGPSLRQGRRNITDKDALQPIQYGIPVYYQIPVVDGSGQMIQNIQLERMERKTNGVVSLLSKLCFKKKSRADIVKLVASGDMIPEQLIQIKCGIEKGLTEGQLVELINNNLSAEKMKEIIEIAVLENSMAY